MINKEVKKLYDELINPTEALSEDDFLDKLIKIEDITKYNIFHNLLSYTDKNNIKELIKLYWNQIIKSKFLIRNRLERQSLDKLIWEKITIWEILDKYIEQIKKVFAEDTPLTEKLSYLKITYDYIDWVIFPPEWDTRIQPWSWKWLNTKEWYDRINLLFNEILNIENNVYLWDFRVIIGKDNNNSLRKYSYVVIEIPKLNKTIFVNNRYWEATYIYGWIPTDKSLLTKWKESLKDLCTRISFHNTEQWKIQILNSLFKEESENKEGLYKNIKAKDLKDVLNLEEKRECIRNELNKKEVKDLWFSLGVVQRENFKLSDWTTYNTIARIFGVTEESKNLAKNKTFIELNKIIFWEDDPDVINYINTHVEHTIDSIRNLFKNDEQLKKQRFSMKIKERIYFKLNDWTSYRSIAKIFGIEMGNLFNIYTFIELNKRIFGEDDPYVISLMNNNVFHTVDSIRNIFSNDKTLRDKWISLTYAQRKDFKLNDWTTYTNIAKVFWITWDREFLLNNFTFVELNKKIFWESDPNVIDLTKKYIFYTLDSIRNLFADNEQLKQQRFSTNTHKRTRFKLKDWTTYINIARFLGFKENHHDLVKDEIFIEVSKKIFGEKDSDITNYINRNIKHNTDSIRAIFLNDEQLKQQRFSLDIVWRIKFKLKDWTTYTKIARIFWITEKWKNLAKMKVFIELNKRIFWEDDPNVIKLIYNNSDIFHTIDSIKEIFSNNESLKKQWFSLNYIQRIAFKLDDWTNYTKIARIFGFEENCSIIHKDNIFIELSKKIFWEKDSDVINFINTHVEHTAESIRSLFSNNEQLKKQRFSMDYNKRKDFKLDDWTSYIIIARTFWFKEEREELLKDVIFIKLSKKIFWENDPAVIDANKIQVVHNINTIKNTFSNNEQLKKQWFSLKVQKRTSFKLSDWTSYIKIARIFGFEENSSIISKNNIFIELSKKIFWEDDPDVINFINTHVEHSVESIRSLFSNDEQLKKQRFSLIAIQRAKFKLKDWNSYITICRIFGFKERENFLIKDDKFIELNKKIFGEDDPNVIELSKKLSKK